MDDLRTIIGRSFIVVVATRTQITAYIGRAFNSGGAPATWPWRPRSDSMVRVRTLGWMTFRLSPKRLPLSAT